MDKSDDAAGFHISQGSEASVIAWNKSTLQRPVQHEE